MDKSRKNTLIYLFSDLISKSIPFLILPLTTLLLTPAEYGVIFLFVTIQEILQIFVVWGGNSYYKVMYFKDNDVSRDIYHDSRKLSFLIMIAVTILFFLVTFSGTTELLGFSPYWLLAIPFICFVQSAILLNLAYLQCEQKAVQFGIITFSMSFFSALIFLWLLKLDYSVNARFASILVSVILAYLISSHLIAGGPKPQLKEGCNQRKAIILFGFSVFPHALSWWMRAGADRFLFNHYFSETTVGLYSLSLQLVLPMVMVINAISQAYMPSIYSALKANSFDKLSKIVFRTWLLIASLAMIIYLVKGLVFDYVIDERYYDAQNILGPLLLGSVFQFLVVILGNVFYYYESGKALSIISFISAVLHVAMSAYFSITDQFYLALYAYPISFSITVLLMMGYIASIKRGIDAQ